MRTTLVLGLVGLAVALFYSCLAFRYDLAEVASMPERSVVLDHTGREIATLHGANRRLLTRDDIPPFFIEALEAREDKRFFSHLGVDAMGLLRATGRNLRDRSFTQGASTLSMQLARNTFELREQTLHRKLLEIAITFRIEAHYSKDEILTCYLNRIYFGSGCHGLDEAARTYFGIPASELNRNQCALLVGIIRAPHACSPFRNLEGAHRQRDEVLDRLVAEQQLAEEEVEEILATPLALLKEPNHGSMGRLAPLIRRHFEELLAETDRREGGLVLTTTLDARTQAVLEEELERLSPRLPSELEVAAIVLDPASGAIRAAIGGRESSPGRFHRALDARRDLGPVFAPFVSAAAAERGLEPSSDPVASGARLGAAETVRLAERFGFTGPFGKAPDLYRGNLSATPLELATAAATLVRDGRRPRTHLLTSLRSGQGTLLFQNDPQPLQAFSRGAVREALENNFPADDRPLLVRPSLGRSDLWGLSLAPDRVVCLWIGNDRPAPLPTSTLTPLLEELLRRLEQRLDPPRQAFLPCHPAPSRPSLRHAGSAI